jgi:hypothetical protein
MRVNEGCTEYLYMIISPVISNPPGTDSRDKGRPLPWPRVIILEGVVSHIIEYGIGTVSIPAQVWLNL